MTATLERGSRWAGAGYGPGPSTAEALVGTRPEAPVGADEGAGGRRDPEEASAPAAGDERRRDPEGAEAPPPPPESGATMAESERWRITAPGAGSCDAGRHELGGWWRRVLRRASFGAYKGLESEAVWRHRLAVDRALAPMPDAGPAVTVVAQPKGAVGRSTVSALAVSALVEYTHLSPVLWDCSENGGARWAVGATSPTVENLLGAPAHGTIMSQVEAAAIDQDRQAYQVIAAPSAPRNLAPREFQIALAKVAQRFSQVIVDTSGTLTGANLLMAVERASIVLVPTDLAPATMAPTLALFGTLERRFGPQWGRHVIGVVTNPIKAPDKRWEEFFCSSVAEVVRIPYDDHIAARGRIAWSELAPATREAGLALAGAITDAYRRVFNPVKTESTSTTGGTK